MMLHMKTCNRCNILQEFSFFNKDKHTKDKFSNRCKSCQKEIRDQKKGRKSRKYISSLREANIWLRDNCPRYQILEWGETSSQASLFLDRERHVKFSYSFSRFKDKIQKYPERIFNPSSTEMKEKVRNSFKEKYGVECALQVKKFKEKAQQTNLNKFGVDNPMKSSKFRKEKGLIKLIDGKTIGEWAEDLGVSYSHFRNVMAYEGLDVAKNLKINKTNLESAVELILNKNNIDFKYNVWHPELKIRPDFTLTQDKLLIECNGNRWHSDEFIQNKNFHQKRLEKIELLGWRCLFFTTPEIINKSHIIESIIKNKIGKSQKIGARTCSVEQIEISDGIQFFEKNHLMSKGSGRIYGLKKSDNIQGAMQVKWKNKTNKILEISRFCTKNGTSIIGGFSKLLAYVIKQEAPKKIITFIDRRYGKGNYLTSLGFEREGVSLSFAWADNKNCYHRMKFPGNTGYDNGLWKLWDCGQAKWSLII